MKKKPVPCPCGRPARFDLCCGRLIGGDAVADTPETLMRSRYSAFATGAPAYLLLSWHSSTRPAELSLDDIPRWIGLQIVRSGMTGPESGTVEFIARFRDGGKAGTLHEVSRFVRENGRWYYVDGDIQPD